MSWDEVANKVATTIGPIFIALTDNDGTSINHIITYNVQVLDQNGDVLDLKAGDLEPHLVAGQKTAIVDFLAEIRAKAEAEFLP